MKKYIIFFTILLLSCKWYNVIRNITFTKFNIEYNKPVYYKLGKKIYYSKDIYVSDDDKLIYDNCYLGGHVSPDYNYIVIQGEKSVILFDKNGNKIKEFFNCYFDLLQWGPNSKQFLILYKKKKNVHLLLYSILNNTIKIVFKNIFISDEYSFTGSMYSELIRLNDSYEYAKQNSRFYFSKTGIKIYLISHDYSFHVEVYDIGKGTKIDLLNIKIKILLKNNNLGRLYNQIINDLFIYYYDFNFKCNYPFFFSSYGLKKFIFYNYIEFGEKKTGFWLFKNGDYTHILSMANAQGLIYDFHIPPPNATTYFLSEGRYFIMSVYFNDDFNFFVYDTDKNLYMKLFKKTQLERYRKDFYKNFVSKNKHLKNYFYKYFKFLFPITSNDTPTHLNYQRKGERLFTNNHFIEIKRIYENFLIKYVKENAPDKFKREYFKFTKRF